MLESARVHIIIHRKHISPSEEYNWNVIIVVSEQIFNLAVLRQLLKSSLNDYGKPIKNIMSIKIYKYNKHIIVIVSRHIFNLVLSQPLKTIFE